MYSLSELIAAKYKGREELIPKRMLCLDPGNDTGWSYFENGNLVRWGQLDTAEDKGGVNGSSTLLFWKPLQNLFFDCAPTVVVCENYRVYSHKLERHTFSEIPTLRLIGGIDFLAFSLKTQVFYQMATAHKGFVTDDKLKYWGLWKEGQRHSRDSIRAGVYYLLVSNPALKMNTKLN